jgi:hypothetical protein
LLQRFSSQTRALSDATLEIDYFAAIAADLTLSQQERTTAEESLLGVVDANLAEISLGYETLQTVLKVLPIFILYLIKNILEVTYAYLRHK